jgi:hypothetical protein
VRKKSQRKNSNGKEHTLLKLLKTLKSDLELIRVGEGGRVVEDFHPKK